MYLLTEHPVSAQKLVYWGLPHLRVIHAVPDSGIVLVNLPCAWSKLRQLSWRKGIRWGLLRITCLPRPLRSLAAWLYHALPICMFGVRHADFVLCAGTEGANHPLVGPETMQLHTCAPDVFHRDDGVSDRAVFPEPYAVFLDEAIAVPHPDYALLHQTPPDSRVYDRELIDAFQRARLSHASGDNLPIMHAPHPSQVSLHSADWHTPNLVAHASWIVAHSSTAVSFAVLRNKPITILHLPCLQGRSEGRHAHAMEAALKNYADYTQRYLGIPEAMAAKRTPMEALAAYA